MGLTSEANAALHTETDAASLALHNAAESMDAEAQAAARAAAVRQSRSVAGAGAIGRMKNMFSSWSTRIRGGLGRSEIAAASDKAASMEADSLSRSSTSVRAEADELRTASSGDKLTKATQKAEAQGISTSTYVAGIAGITLVSLSLASWISTDGARLNINDITIVNTTSGPIVKVQYDVASVNAGGLMSNFGLRVGDYVEFDQPTQTVPNLTGDQQVVAVEGDHTFYIKPTPPLVTAGGVGISPASVTGTPSGVSGAPIGSSYWHGATVHSSFTNQLTGQMSDGISILGAALGTGLAVVVTSAATVITGLTPAGVELLGSVANAAGGAFHALTPALGGAFCDIVPFACNSTLWWSVGGICLCLIIVAIIMKMKGR